MPYLPPRSPSPYSSPSLSTALPSPHPSPPSQEARRPSANETESASPTLSESIDMAITSLQELALRLGVTLPPPPPALPSSVPASVSPISRTLVFADIQATPNFISPSHRHVSSSRATSSNVPAPHSSSNPTTAHTIQGDTDHSMTTSPDKNPAQPSRIPIFTTWDRSMAHIFHAPSGAPPPIIVTSVEAGH